MSSTAGRSADRWAAKYAVWREAFPDNPDRVARAVVREIISEVVEEFGLPRE
jgi:hypothetical protein